MPNARPNVIPLVCEWFQNKSVEDIKSVLDIGCGFGKWGFLARLYIQAWDPELTKEAYQNWRSNLQVDAIEIFEDYITDLQRLIYNHIYIGDMRKLIEKVENYDLIIMGDVLEHIPLEDGLELLKKARAKAKWVVVTMPDYFIKGKSNMGNEAEVHHHVWSDSEFPDSPKITNIERQRVIFYEDIPMNTKLFLSPHSDDEALFGAFTIMREKPLVVVATDSYIQELRGDDITFEQRRSETKRAMEKLGVESHFLGIADNAFTGEALVSALENAPENIRNAEVVYAPMIEGGNKIHDIVGEVADEMFDSVFHYSTYTKTRPYPAGDIEVKPTAEERKLKNEILEEYHTQKNHKYNKTYFQHAKIRNEYFSTCKFGNLMTSLKAQALENLVDTKRVFDELGIPFCLMDGTLLGAYRDGDFIAGDYDDTDIGFDAKYFDRVPSIFKKLEEAGLKKFKQWDFRGKFEGGAVARGGNHVDFFCIHRNGKEAYNLGRNFLDNSKEYMAYVYPAECFTKFDKLIFKGMEFNIPAKTEDFLKARYGDWKTPIGRDEGFNWLNREQNPCLTTDYEI